MTWGILLHIASVLVVRVLDVGFDGSEISIM
jgi:hypothetical protein